MLNLEAVLQSMDDEQRQLEADDKYFGEWVFHEWRLKYIALLCKAIRHVRRMQARGLKTAINPDECNAAALLLEVGPTELQDRFLRSTPEQKTAIAVAVNLDGGIYDERGFFVEVPPL